MAQLQAGDLVIRRHRLLKTRGTILHVALRRRGEAHQVWVQWDHPDTLPNPSLEVTDTLELAPATGLAAHGIAPLAVGRRVTA